MARKLIIILSLFLLSACSESQESKAVTYCMDTMNTYSIVTKGQCLCFYNEASKKFSSADIDKIIKPSPVKKDTTLTSERAIFLTIANGSKCFE